MKAKRQSEKPSVSIISATKNADRFLKQSIESVYTQTYPNIEYIVIDGGSTDGTIKILKLFDKRLKTNDKRSKIKLKWVSEKDRGIADAFNKGVGMAHGDFIYFLGADDVLKTPDVIGKMMEGVDPDKDMIVCGRIERIKQGKKYESVYASSLRFFPLMLLYKMGLPHQGMFMNKKFFETYGLFDITLKYAMDYELLLRAYHNFPNVILKDVVVAGWREGGVGNKKLFEVLEEYHSIRIKNRIAHPFMLKVIHEIVKARYRIAGYV